VTEFVAAPMPALTPKSTKQKVTTQNDRAEGAAVTV
jgi:hypothetical protein